MAATDESDETGESQLSNQIIQTFFESLAEQEIDSGTIDELKKILVDQKSLSEAAIAKALFNELQ